MALRSLLLSLVSVGFLGAAVNPALNEIKTVYLLPMSSGLDQYLADQLTKVGRFQVVTDPKRADAVITDRLGMGFEERWKAMFADPEKPEAKAEEKEKKSSKPGEYFESSSTTRISSFSRGRGNIFFVSRKDGAVVWSTYKTPANSRSKSIHDTARHIVDRLEDDLKPKK